MTPLISVIIPNYNGAATIDRCLQSVYRSSCKSFEVIVVDDCSTDASTAIIEKHPCRLIRLKEHGGASTARNTGAGNSRGELLFFTDADCILMPDTLEKAAAAFKELPADSVIGGTYTLLPHDNTFFSTFQSAFIHYSETKSPASPDYIATHAMLIPADLFKKAGGFDERFLPILEDVEFCHRLKRKGIKLLMDDKVLVQHIFNYSLIKSLQNGFRKSRYWTLYSLMNKDLFADSGTASRELKFNVIACFTCFLLFFLGLTYGVALFVPMALLVITNLYLNRQLLAAFQQAKGHLFAVFAVLYYSLVYPFAVGAGAAAGTINFLFGSRS